VHRFAAVSVEAVQVSQTRHHWEEATHERKGNVLMIKFINLDMPSGSPVHVNPRCVEAVVNAADDTAHSRAKIVLRSGYEFVVSGRAADVVKQVESAANTGRRR
jgi:uncharacterized protein YlzI (FlbEa/FlbD family)